MAGFVVIRREALDHYVVGNERHFRAWCWLIASACWRPTKFNVRGKTITLERGQLCVSRHQLAEEWGWSPSAVERFITRLETEQMVNRQTGQGRSVITICNYAKYQDLPERSGQESGQLTGQKSDSNRTAKEQDNQIIPFPNGNGAVDPDKVFWDSAKDYLGKSKASLIGKWSGEFGTEAVAAAITAAMLKSPQPPDRVAYVGGILKRNHTPTGGFEFAGGPC